MKKTPFRLTPYQVQWLLVVGFLTVGYALYLRYFAIEFSTVALACDAGLQTMLCKTRVLATALFRNAVFGVRRAGHRGAACASGRRSSFDVGTDRRRLWHRALQYRAVGDCDRPAHFGICAARACHSVMANRK